MAKTNVKDVQEVKRGLHIGPDPVRVKAEEAIQTAESSKPSTPTEITLQMIYDRQQLILDQNAWIMKSLRR